MLMELSTFKVSSIAQTARRFGYLKMTRRSGLRHMARHSFPIAGTITFQSAFIAVVYLTETPGRKRIETINKVGKAPRV
jgi:hypothetical protein